MTNVTEVDAATETSDLIDRARRAGNLGTSSQTKNNRKRNKGEKEKTPASKRRSDVEEIENPQELSTLRRSKKIKNSTVFPVDDRPHWLKEDSVIDSLPMSTVANVIAQAKMTQALEKQNEIKAEKAARGKGGVRQDQEVKTIIIKEGEDNASTKLHPQRFLLRTPLLKPDSYWETYPVKWPEVNKKIYLTHLGLDHVISAKTKELVHDRSDPSIQIKMFAVMNVMIGQEEA